MRIIYIGNHDQHLSADDEGAITYALTRLGHNVQRIREFRAHNSYAHALTGDVVLIHKYANVEAIRKLSKTMPVVFWYFDLVQWPDESLAKRNAARVQWMEQVLPLCSLGFCTDGDWVNADKSGKLHWLPQGADERIVGRGNLLPPFERVPPILFTGIGAGGGKNRELFVQYMKKEYGGLFNHIPGGIYRNLLRDYIATSTMVVAPNSPITDNYWSNRVYNSLGFGAFMLHPYARKLAELHYQDTKDIVYYYSIEDLFAKIKYYWDKPALQAKISQSGLERTKREHLYRHRCEKLISIIHEKLGVEDSE